MIENFVLLELAVELGVLLAFFTRFFGGSCLLLTRDQFLFLVFL